MTFADLINDYKSTHGDIPSSTGQWSHARHGLRRGRGQVRGHTSHFTQSYSSLPHASHSFGSWRKTYSLNNKTNRASGSDASHSAVNQPPHHISTSGATATVGLIGSNSVSFKKLQAEQIRGKSASSHGVQNETLKEKKSEESRKRSMLLPATGKVDHDCSSTNETSDSTSSSGSERKIKPTLKSSSAANNPSIPSPVKPAAHLQVKPHLPTSTSSNRTVVIPSPKKDSSTDSSAFNLQSQASVSPAKPQLKLDSTQRHVTSPCHKRSQFTWVKNQEVVNIKTTPKPLTSGSSPGATTTRRVSSSNKRVSRKPNNSPGAPKTSKYTWVSSSCSSSAAGKANTPVKLPRKPLSPKSLKAPVRTFQGGLEGLKREKKYATTTVTPLKKSRAGAATTSHAGLTSRYRWKAAGQNATGNISSSASRTTHKGTVYRWTASNNGQKGEKGSVLSPNILATATLSAGAFKLRSRTKIIRRSPSK